MIADAGKVPFRQQELLTDNQMTSGLTICILVQQMAPTPPQLCEAGCSAAQDAVNRVEIAAGVDFQTHEATGLVTNVKAFMVQARPHVL